MSKDLEVVREKAFSYLERAFQKEGLAVARGLRQDLAWHVEEVTRRLLWLKTERMAEREDMRNKR